MLIEKCYILLLITSAGIFVPGFYPLQIQLIGKHGFNFFQMGFCTKNHQYRISIPFLELIDKHKKPQPEGDNRIEYRHAFLFLNQ